MARQTILFTVMPRGVNINSGTLPVSVFVSPRLYEESRLGSFPDWLNWTQRLRDDGLALTFRANGQTQTLQIDRGPLRPDLWRGLFNERTLVRPHAFNDYTDRVIFSYPVRRALTALKSLYQVAGVTLGLPDRSSQKERSAYRHLIKRLLSGFEVNWSTDQGEGLRWEYRSEFKQAPKTDDKLRHRPESLAADGTLTNMPMAGTDGSGDSNSQIAEAFAVYSHMPQGPPIHEHPPDFDTMVDFHQVLSSLSSYPELLRALGLVLDFELPKDSIAPTSLMTPGRMAVVDVPNHRWEVPTQVPPGLPPIETAYLYSTIGQSSNPWKIFMTAPGVMGGVLTSLEVFGLLNLDPERFGLAQVDVESGMHKNILLAESWQDSRLGLALPEHPEVFDETTTLPSLRTGGYSLFADFRALRLMRTFEQNKEFNDDLEGGTPLNRPFYAEDLVRGLRFDVWDSHTGQWHSLHRRNAEYLIGELTYRTEDEEGFNKIAIGQAAHDPDNPPADDLYLNESIARWVGWSLSVPFPGIPLSRDPDPDKALEHDPNHPLNEPATPFKMTTHFSAVPMSLPALRFGRRYRLRVRAVDLCGNSMKHDDPVANLLTYIMGLPRDPEGHAYLRYEPINAPTVVLRDTKAVTDPGSQLERLVIRTYNDDISKDNDPADLTASDRFIAPPSTSVEFGERMGMFDDANGKLVKNQAMYELIAKRDGGTFNHVEVMVAGQNKRFPLESGDAVDVLPYLPDVLARGTALRDLPGTPDLTLASVEPGTDPMAPVPYETLDDANPRTGSATLISFGGSADWQKLQPFRLALADGNDAPTWDPQGRVLTVFLPKATKAVTPLSSYLLPDDLKLMGVWQWLREYIDRITVSAPNVPVAYPGLDQERIAHLLQRAVEGGHWMINPPRLLALVHAVQQPIGHPEFTAISVQHEPYGSENALGIIDEKLNPDPDVLQTAPESIPTEESELAPITAWRKPGSEEAYLLGGLKIHAASTEKIDLLAEWEDPTDDPGTPRVENESYLEKDTAQADEIPIPSTEEVYITTGSGANYRMLAYYDADHDLLCFVRSGDVLGNLKSGDSVYADMAPRHHFNDTKYHRVRYTARATTRFREYFPKNQGLDFTRSSPSIWVDVPASARPTAPLVDYVVPTFGWQRQTQTNLKRSVRFGGGLRVYLNRPWYSSGDGELLGVALYDYENGDIKDVRELWKPFVTQWGIDPIWKATGLSQLPTPWSFPNTTATECGLSLPGRAPGRVCVAGFPVEFDYDKQKWFADLTVNTSSLAYTPFIRLALVRYQPFALPDSKLSSVVLADFSQLTPERSAVITADPYHPRTLRLTVSGPAPSGPRQTITHGESTRDVGPPSLVTVTVQKRIPSIKTDLGWQDAPASAAKIERPLTLDPTGLILWTGTVEFAAPPKPGQYRVLIREYECISSNYEVVTRVGRGKLTRREPPKRLVYAEAIAVDAALISGPSEETGTTV